MTKSVFSNILLPIPTPQGWRNKLEVVGTADYTAADVLAKIKTVDGSGSGLDADTVDGLHASSFALTTAVREKLSANRTYYVRTDGSDSNTGLVNSSGGAFLTIQKAIDVVAALDRSIYNVTIQLGDGTYTAGGTIKPSVGSGTITIQGNSGTPANVVVNVAGPGFAVSDGASVTIKDMTIAATGWCFTSQYYSQISFSNIRFSTAGIGHIYCNAAGSATATGNYSIVGAGSYHWYAENAGIIRVTSRTVTITGTPAFSVFAVCATVGSMTVFSNTFSGSATGQRYLAFLNGVISVNAAGATYLPGSTAGGTATGGQYA